MPRQKNERKKKETSGGETEESRESTALYGKGLRESEGGPLERPAALGKVKVARVQATDGDKQGDKATTDQLRPAADDLVRDR